MICYLTTCKFAELQVIADLAKKLVETKKHKTYPYVNLFAYHFSTSIATTSVERAFSAMNIIKN